MHRKGRQSLFKVEDAPLPYNGLGQLTSPKVEAWILSHLLKEWKGILANDKGILKRIV